MADTVTTATYQLRVTGLDQVKTADDLIKALSVSQNQATASATSLAAANTNTGASFQVINTATGGTVTQLTRFIGTLDRATKAELDYQRGLNQIAKAQASGVDSAADLARATELVTRRREEALANLTKSNAANDAGTKGANDNAKALGNLGNAAKLTFTDTEILRSGVVNVVQSLAAGESAARTFQTQLFQIGPAIPGLVRSLGGMGIAAGAAGVALGAVTVALVALGAHAISEEQHIKQFNITLAGIGDAGLATGAGLEKAAKDMRDLGLSADEARKAITSISTSGLNPAFSRQIAGAGAGIGAITGSGTAAGINDVTKALTGGVQATIDLATHYGALTAAQAKNFEEMARNGQSAQALTQILALLDTKVTHFYKDSLTPFQTATNELAKAWDNLLDTLGKQIAPNLQKFFSDMAGLANDVTKLFGGTPSGPGYFSGGQQGQVIPIAPPTATGTGTAGRVSMAPGVVTAPGVETLRQILGDASSVLPPGQSFQIFSGVGSRSGDSLHPGGDAVDVRVVDAGGRPVDTGIVGRPSMGGGLPTPEMDRAILTAAQTRGLQISIGSLFSNPDPGHYGIGANREVASNQAKQGQLPAGTPGATVTGTPGATAQQQVETDRLTKSEQDNIAVTQQMGLSADVLAAKQRAATDAERLGLDVNQKTQLEQIYVAAAVAKTTAAFTQQNTAVDNATIGENALAAAYAKSGKAVVEQQATTQALAEVTQMYGNAVDKTQQIEERRAIILGKMASAEKVQNAEDIRAQTDTQQLLTAQLGLVGQTSDEIQRQITILRAKQDIEEKFPLLSQKEKDARLASVEATADLVVKLQEAQREQQRIDDTFRSIGQTIDSAITGQLEKLFSGQKIESWGTIFKQVLASIQTQLLDMAIIKPAIGSVLSIFSPNAAQSFGTFGGGGAGLLGGLFSAGNSSQAASGGGATIKDSSGNTVATISSAGNVVSLGSGSGSGGGIFGGITNFLNNKIGTSIGFASSGSNIAAGSGAGEGILTNLTTGATSDVAGSGVSAGLFGGTTLTGALGFAGLGGTVGSLAGQLLGFGNQGIGGTIASGAGGLLGGLAGGALLGSALGSFAGPLGSIVGGLAGQFLSGLFGNSKPPNLASTANVSIASGALGATSSSGVAANDAASQSIVAPIAQTIQSINQILGQTILPEETLIAQAGSRDGLKAVLRGGFGAQTFSAADQASLSNQIGEFLFKQIDLSKFSETAQKVLGSLSYDQFKDPNQLTQAKQFADAYDAVKTAADDAFKSVEQAADQVKGPFATAMDQINATFAALTDQANKFGLSLDPLNAGLAEATKRLQGDFKDALNTAFNTSTGSGFLNDIQTTVANYKSLNQEASAIGLGGDRGVTDQIGQILNNSFAQIIAPLSSTQLDQVIAAVSELGYTDLPAMAKAAKDAAAATEAATAALNRQAAQFQILQAYDTARGADYLSQLRTLDQNRQATQAQARAIGLDDASVNMAQETEHQAALNVLRQLNNDQLEESRKVLADLNPAFASWVDEAKGLIQASNDAATATQAAADAEARHNAILQAGLQIRQYLNSLETGPDYTSPLSRLTAARSQFGTQLGLAQGGDLTALQGITGVADSLKQALLGYFASGPAGSAEFEEIKRQLAALPGVPSADQTSTNAIVDAITNTGQKTVDAVGTATNASAATIVATTISTNAQIVQAGRDTSRDIIAATGDSSDAITGTTIDTSNAIITNASAGSASIVGAVTVGLDLLTKKSDNSAVVAAAVGTSDAVAASTVSAAQGTVSLLASNQANAQTLLAGSKEDAASMMQQQEANSGALLAANQAQSSTLTAQIAADAQAVAAKTDATTAAITNSIFAAAGAEVGAIYGSSSNQIGATFDSSNAVVGSLYSISATTIAAIYSAANSIVGAIGWQGQTGGIAEAVWNVNGSVVGWGNAINSTLGGINANTVAWSQNIYNVIADMSNRIAGWGAAQVNQLDQIRRYLQFLAEVTVQFDEWMAGVNGAQLDAMNDIQNTLRRQAFG